MEYFLRDSLWGTRRAFISGIVFLLRGSCLPWDKEGVTHQHGGGVLYLRTW